MTDEKKNISPDDEYQFPQDEYISTDSNHRAAFGTDAPSETTSGATGADQSLRGRKWIDYLKNLKNIKNKRVVLVIVVLIILIIGYHLFGGGEKAPTIPKVVTQP